MEGKSLIRHVTSQRMPGPGMSCANQHAPNLGTKPSVTECNPQPLFDSLATSSIAFAKNQTTFHGLPCALVPSLGPESLRRWRTMTKIHPNTSVRSTESALLPTSCYNGGSVVLTVWRKSLVFSCSGFTVFDANGDLVFRVDSYGSGSPGELVLMDAAGKPLLTIRRKKLSLSLADTWRIYDGEDAGSPLLDVKRHVSLRQSKVLAHVTAAPGSVGGYVVEGSYGRRSCSIYDELRRRRMADVQRKEASGGVEFGGEVFRLVVHSAADHDARLAMAVVIVLDQMFGSRSS
ncbi:hypothetical protein ZIOFF_040474 [Zingiber officinale]|uniref:Protein LURP-one-related 8 n=2 Tax=Zingiber officinale TaxID=94328 RepID=A0A8J5G6C0_ZINOF|nr:hypothetical protein ZIOFF_040474 [Zingiber officinale]